jgi:hypothetical protein
MKVILRKSHQRKRILVRQEAHFLLMASRASMTRLCPKGMLSRFKRSRFENLRQLSTWK